ncbi:maleylpyruvate isomerase family mycothiol-dependent enzyme [Aeromicrobium sp. CF3.5]|uniref:maleylpyruvate isomerase family mycothiol-dependent enzyme n=1 Tax=Aeromicrobium sp. CF3.5 TaxID=3373078 RepID=UPI003EE62470
MSDVWPWVSIERQALVDDLTALEPAEWDTTSWCPGWTVHDVAAHLVDNAKATSWGLFVAMARARFDFDRQNQQGVDRERGETPDVTLDRLRAVVSRTTGPPVSTDSRLVEEIVHGQDIRGPLGIAHDYVPEAIDRALRYQARTSAGMGGAKQRVEGLTLRATDIDMVVGSGPEVYGPAVALLMVASGRAGAAGSLSGPGLNQLLTGPSSTE